MNLFLYFLSGGSVTYAPGCDDMWYLEIGGMLFAVFVVAIPTLVLRCLFLETTQPRTKLILSGFMVLVYIATVIGLAWYLCALVPTASVWNAWVAAFLGGTIWTVLMVAITWFCRPKRQLTEKDKMKLRDI